MGRAPHALLPASDGGLLVGKPREPLEADPLGEDLVHRDEPGEVRHRIPDEDHLPVDHRDRLTVLEDLVRDARVAPADAHGLLARLLGL